MTVIRPSAKAMIRCPVAHMQHGHRPTCGVTGKAGDGLAWRMPAGWRKRSVAGHETGGVARIALASSAGVEGRITERRAQGAA
jgi:hypothetical protein